MPTCIDDELASIGLNTAAGFTFVNEDIQFTSQGAVVYAGRRADGRMLVRQFLNGVTTDLIPPDNVTINNMLVLADDTVLITGKTDNDVDSQWTRRIFTTAPILRSVSESDGASFMSIFPDGKPYLGKLGGDGRGIGRLDLAANTIESKAWFHDNNISGGQWWDSDDVCAAAPCSTSDVRAGYGTTDDRQIALMRSADNSRNRLMQLYGLGEPKVKLLPSTVGRPTSMLGFANNVVVTGLNAAGSARVTAMINPGYEPGTENYEKVLIPEGQFEVFHMDYRASGNKILFDGLRFSDNKYVIGHVTLSGVPVVTASAAGQVKWKDVQAFG